MLQAESGYIWLATYAGLVKFDGNKFTTYNSSNVEGIQYDRILNVFEGADRDVWVLPEEIEPIIGHFKDGEMKMFTFPGESKSKLEIYVHNDDTWLTAAGKVYKFINNKFIEAPLDTAKILESKALNKTNDVWMFEENKIFYSEGDSVSVYKELLPSEGLILGMIEFPKGSNTLYLGTQKNVILRIEGDEQIILQEEEDLPPGKFLRYYSDNKNLFAIVGGKLLLWNGQTFEPFMFKADLPENLYFEDIIADYEGNYWLGTEGDGLFKLRPTAISMIDKDQGLENEKMLSLTTLKDGRMLFSTNCGGIYEWKNGKATLSAIQKHMSAVCNWSIFEDSKNNIWVGDATLYMTKSLNEPGKYFIEKDGFTTNGVRGILEDMKGNIWVASNVGVFKYDGVSFENYTSKDGLYNDYTNTIYEDRNGSIWVGTAYGANKISDNKVTKIELIHNVGDTSKFSQPNIRSFFEDENGTMWIGSYGNGLFRLKNGQVNNITTEHGLFDNVVSHLVLDELGNFWMGSNSGISRVSRRDLNIFFDGNIEEVKSYSYGISDGMNSPETNGGFTPSTITDSLGNIYFPTVQGVAVVSTRQIISNNVPPPVYIENLRTVDGGISNAELIELPYDNPFLEIEYTAVSFSSPKKMNFKYRMLGLDDSWIDVGNRRAALYSKIPPGEYTFQVIASNNDGVWNTTGASVHLKIIPPFWQTPWFIVGISLLFLSAIGMGIYYRLLFFKKENEKQKRFSQQLIDSQEQERRRIASELHDGLGQQILVIKNRVEMAQNNVKSDKNLDEELHEIMESATISIQEVRAISHALRPVHLEKFGLTEAIKNLYNQLEQTSAIEWINHIDDIDGLISKDKDINFYRVLQEGSKNILKHSSAKQASIIIRRFETEIRVIMSDDGTGFDLKEKQDSSGLGFLGMQERIDTLGGSLTIESQIGEGTVIKIILPIT